ncbi:hypothetical protein AMATHDRAFT_6923 [Amanita thiersii Skay4041]|uniref:Uncharacterized protein n=1 Tax=Amanita thiersii Skay4041 TaxID=703135 RepID=A0A2A9N8V8_9AGAR|nr:hypothetical protein AMATHDRAFT_6923 [Amanita thiersii Skay4041]
MSVGAKRLEAVSIKSSSRAKKSSLAVALARAGTDTPGICTTNRKHMNLAILEEESSDYNRIHPPEKRLIRAVLRSVRQAGIYGLISEDPAQLLMIGGVLTYTKMVIGLADSGWPELVKLRRIMGIITNDIRYVNHISAIWFSSLTITHRLITRKAARHG